MIEKVITDVPFMRLFVYNGKVAYSLYLDKDLRFTTICIIGHIDQNFNLVFDTQDHCETKVPNTTKVHQLTVL